MLQSGSSANLMCDCHVYQLGRANARDLLDLAAPLQDTAFIERFWGNLAAIWAKLMTIGPCHVDFSQAAHRRVRHCPCLSMKLARLAYKGSVCKFQIGMSTSTRPVWTYTTIMDVSGICGFLQPHHKIRPLWEALLRQFGGGPGKLNDCHVALFDCLLPLMNSCRATGDDAAAISHLQSVLGIYTRVLPLPIPELGEPCRSYLPEDPTDTTLDSIAG